jgi:hypothetical protein
MQRTNGFVSSGAKKHIVLLAAAAAASGLMANSQRAQAQTWVNPNTGSWSIAANWVGGVAPVQGAGTALTFNATGAQTYSAFNDSANPSRSAR